MIIYRMNNENYIIWNYKLKNKNYEDLNIE
jgi:hypothetical protein